MDRMFIRDLRVKCVIGTKPEERTKRQEVIVNVEIECDLGKAGRSDKLDDTINYSRICDDITAMARKSKFHLIEALGENAARLCLRDRRVKMAIVTIDKPSALKDAGSAAIRIRRSRGGRSK